MAIKAINLENDPEAIEEIRKEIGVLANCDSPNIIRYLGSYLVGMSLWIVMDYCALGSLRGVIVSKPQSAWQYLSALITIPALVRC